MSTPTITKNKDRKKTKKSPAKTPVTHVLAIIDESGSMDGKQTAVISGLNEIRAALKKDVKKGDSTVTFSMLKLNNIVLPWTHLKSSAEAVPVFTQDHYSPGGMTPLYDAIGTGCRTLEEDEDANKDNVAFVVYILTDGLENASRKYTSAMIQSTIKRLEATGRWTFIWSITKADFAQAAQDLNFNVRNMQSYDNTVIGTANAASTTANGLSFLLLDRRRGVTATPDFYATYTDESSAPIEVKPAEAVVKKPRKLKKIA